VFRAVRKAGFCLNNKDALRRLFLKSFVRPAGVHGLEGESPPQARHGELPAGRQGYTIFRLAQGCKASNLSSRKAPSASFPSSGQKGAGFRHKELDENFSSVYKATLPVRP
jgi:hypothetical protein